MVWHGADVSGTRVAHAYCEAWHTDAQSNVGLASDLIKGELLGQEKISCNHKLVVLCIEIASQHHYRRKRSVEEVEVEKGESETESDNLPNYPELSKYYGLLHNLTFDEYSKFIEDYDEGLEKNANGLL